LDILSGYNFGKKTSKVSMKPMDFSCIVKCSNAQLMENGFKDTILNEIYAGILECLHYSSNKIAFPELIVPALVQMRGFLKKCRIPNYTKKIKQLLDKTNENVQFVLGKRKKVNDFGVRDLEKIRVWESVLRQQGPPLSKFFESWNKIKEQETLKIMSDQVKMDDYNFIPKMKNKKNKEKNQEEFKGIFGEEEESDEVCIILIILS
jgi:nucleolar complex protein 2